MEQIAALLVSAHIIGDFALQPKFMAENKQKPVVLLLHAAIHATLAWALCLCWTCWIIPVSIFIAHGVIDLLKQRNGMKPSTSFIIDQIAHIIFLLLLAGVLSQLLSLPVLPDLYYKGVVLSAGLVAATRGSGFLVGLVTREILDNNNLKPDGLIDGGQLIGLLERGLIFLFLLIGQPMAIGFLVTAKSILRFEEAKQQPFAEYILIGTLLSFALAIALSALAIRVASPGT
ncbi:MAG: DUF3307 domain-containing protein [Prosthecochloris sp.]|nr:DUF3307 domain-containing protein [Prosthecochloris sp.]